MGINDFYKHVLDAPVSIPPFWGARSHQGTLFLNVWVDEQDIIEGTMCAMMLFKMSERKRSGFKERNEHLALMKSGVETYGVICTAVDPAAQRRRIKTVDDETLLKLGRLIEKPVCVYAEIVDRVPSSEVVKT